MNEREALLAAIQTHPEEDTPRLVFADWVQEFGDEATAEFIRVQVALARTPERDPTAVELRRRESELLAAYRALWVGTRASIAPIDAWEFERGFVAGLNLARKELGATGVAALVASRHLANISTLDLSFNLIGAAGESGVEALANSPFLAHLMTLNLNNNAICAAGVEALAASPYLDNLTTLNLENNAIGTYSLLDAGMSALAASPLMTKLTSLDLDGNTIGTAGVAAFASSLWVTKLTKLNLRRNLIRASGAEALAQSRHLANLSILDLCTNSLGAAGVEVLIVDAMRYRPHPTHAHQSHSSPSPRCTTTRRVCECRHSRNARPGGVDGIG